MMPNPQNPQLKISKSCLKSKAIARVFTKYILCSISMRPGNTSIKKTAAKKKAVKKTAPAEAAEPDNA